MGEPDLWFTDDPERKAQAVTTCHACPVRLPCLVAGLHDPHGVWGGLDPEQRRELRHTLPTERRARAALLEHHATRQERTWT